MPSNNNETLEALIEHEWPKLRRFFRTKVADADALDLVQNTMLAYISGRPTPGTERAYLWGIARKQVLKHYEKHRHGGDPFNSSEHGVPDVGPSLSSKIDRREHIVAALIKLPADYQMAVELRYGEGLELQEVADALEVSLATVKRYLDHAMTTLREEFRDAGTVAESYRKL
jgi:RNA polymerase sigma-70 factor (ECF subfamily)